MSQLLTEIDALIEAVAARLPASIDNPENAKAERAFRKVLAAYFLQLAKEWPYAEIAALYDAKVKEVAPTVPRAGMAEYEDWLRRVLKAFGVRFTSSVITHLGQIYLQGSTQMLSYGHTKMGLPLLWEGPPIQAAIDWAQQHGATLVTKMDEETQGRLAQIIADGIENKRGIQGISRDIRQEFEDMSKARADMISQTETSFALSTAAMDRGRDMGLDGKHWIPVDDPCEEICQPNADDGVIPLDQAFSSGHMNTPGHPRCRCAISLVRLNRED